MTDFAEMLHHTDVQLCIRGRVGVLVLHGGIEGGTAEIAERVGSLVPCSSLTFVQRGAGRVHVSSRYFDPDVCPPLREFLSHVDLSYSIHGHQRNGHASDVFLGGLNRELAENLGAELRRACPGLNAVTDLREIPAGLRGLDLTNPVNRTRKPGVQVELPPAARGVDDPHARAGTPAEPDPRVVDALARSVRGLLASAR